MTAPRSYALVLLGVMIALAGGAAFVYVRFFLEKTPEQKMDTRVTEREPKGIKFKRPEHAVERGIVAEQVRATTWQPKLFVDGRVLPNPQATLEIRAPFAGILRADAAAEPWGLGSRVDANKPLGRVEARFTATEKLDWKSKLAEAEARLASAEEVLNLSGARLKRLEKISAGILPQDEFDAASLKLFDARLQKNIAQSQYLIWKKALEDRSSSVQIVSPIRGEVTEIGAHFGANVDAGQMLARVVDFSRVLLRLDFPLSDSAAKAPARVQVEALGSAGKRWSAGRRGPVANLEIALQKASWYYEIMPDKDGQSPHWQPGLYVKSILDDPAAAAQPAVAMPASALLVHQGRTLVYIELRVGRYERREVDVLGRDGDTLYVNPFDDYRGVRGSEAVVAKNAQVLLSEEFRAESDED